MVALIVQFGQVIPHLKALGRLVGLSQFWIHPMMLRNDMGHSVKRTVEIRAVALWYHLLLEKFSKHVNIAKALFSIIVVENPHIFPCLVTF